VHNVNLDAQATTPHLLCSLALVITLSAAVIVLCCLMLLQFIIGLGLSIAFAAAVPKLGATKGYIRAGAGTCFV
jgi:hypothetical protein